MKRRLVTTLFAAAITCSAFAFPSVNGLEASAATTSVYSNQQAVETKADQLIATAKDLIGKATYSNTVYQPTYPYKFSCATFIMYIFEQNGVDIATYNENYMMQQGVQVSRDQLQKGDLVFFDANKNDNEPSDHVAMYIGDNKVIHMADPKQNIVITDMDSKPYYTENYVTARRVLPSLLPANPASKGDEIVDFSYSLKDKVTIGSTNDEATKKFTSTGFVHHVYDKNGIHLGASNIKELMNHGETVAREDLQKGDLIFFSSAIGSKNPGLVAIYAGDHRIMIPTSNGILTRVLFVDYYDKRYLTAKRVMADNSHSPVDTPASTDEADQLVDFGLSLIGKASYGYGYNESSLTFTGAGFTYYVYKQFGIDLKHKLASRQAQLGQPIEKANLEKGDLVFFSLNNRGTNILHTGIYIGDHKVIHLSQSDGLVIESLDTQWSKNNYVTARRVR